MWRIVQFELGEVFLPVRLALLLWLFLFTQKAISQNEGVHIRHHIKQAYRRSMPTAGFYLLSKSEITTVL